MIVVAKRTASLRWLGLLLLTISSFVVSVDGFNTFWTSKERKNIFKRSTRESRPILSTPSPTTTTTTALCGRRSKARKQQEAEEDGTVGTGNNWIERAFPVDDVPASEKTKTKKVDNYHVGINGQDFGTGPLSRRMFDAMTQQSNLLGGAASLSDVDDDILNAFRMYAMDFTAKEATRVALFNQGLNMVLDEEHEDSNDTDQWGNVDSIRLGGARSEIFDTIEDACSKGQWQPGQSFSFVVRNVPAKMTELSVSDIMSALDPSGEMTQQAENKGMPIPDEDLNSLSDLYHDNVRRCEEAPRPCAVKEEDAFAGDLSQRGYRIMKRSSLILNEEGVGEKQVVLEDNNVLMHVMNAMVNHGALVVDVSESADDVKAMADMWSVVGDFFETLNDDPSLKKRLPGMQSIVGMNSSAAKVGYQEMNDAGGLMQFLEGRWIREESANLLPAEAFALLGRTEGLDTLGKSFRLVTDIGKDVVRVATAASTMENFGFVNFNELDPAKRDKEEADAKSVIGAQKLVAALIDDAKPSVDRENDEDIVSMSPQRLCRYSGPTDNKSGSEKAARAAEVFGAHTDSSFVTMVPVSAVSGLEVYDEDQEQWYRPELAAREDWNQKNPGVDVDENGLPWHARYVVIMPGEFLQIVSRDEVPAAVHRVVAVGGISDGGASRLSAPILLRGRSGMKLDVENFLGDMNNGLLEATDGKKMSEIHDMLQPSTNKKKR